MTVGDAIAGLLAHLCQLRPDQLGDDTIDQLVDGASSRRNQVLMDLGKEFGVGSVDGAHEAARSDLVDQLTPMVRGHHHPGPVLAAAVSAGLTRGSRPTGFRSLLRCQTRAVRVGSRRRVGPAVRTRAVAGNPRRRQSARR